MTYRHLLMTMMPLQGHRHNLVKLEVHWMEIM